MAKIKIEINRYAVSEKAGYIARLLADIRVSGIAGIVGPAIFSVLTFVAELLYHGDALHNSVSTLALGRYGWIQISAFVLAAVLMVIMARVLYKTLAPSRQLKAAAVMLWLVGLGFIMICIFKTDLVGAPMTLEGSIHTAFGGTVAIAFPIACFLLVGPLRQDPNWRCFAAYTLVTACLGIALGIAQVTVPQTFNLFGLQERLMGVNGLLWVGVMSAQAVTLSNAPLRATADLD